MFAVVKRTVRRRAGFTLMELLVVMAIVGVLVSLAAVAVFRTVGTQQARDTRSELARMEGAFKKAYRSAADNFSKEPIPPQGTALGNVYYTVVLPNAGNDRLRAKVLWTKLRLKQAFPANFNEALSPAPMPPLSHYATKLGALGYTTLNTNAANPQPFESSACLLLALQRGEDGPGLQQNDIGGSTFFQEFPTGLNNGKTVTAIIDGWQKPLVYVRWPVYLKAPKYNLTGTPLPHPPNPAYNDADDPTGELASATWQATAGFTWFLKTCHGLNPHAANTEPQTYQVFPIIASSGQNGVLGFNPNVVTFGNPVGSTTPPTVGVSTDADDLLATLNP